VRNRNKIGFSCYFPPDFGLKEVEGESSSWPSLTSNHNQLVNWPDKKDAVMKIPQSKTASRVSTLHLAVPILSLLLGAYISASHAEPGNDNRAPEVPISLRVPEGNKVSFHAYASGVQIYIATTSTNSPTGFVWTFRAPEAVLFDADANVVGIHYAFAGPTRPAWESESGSRVIGARTVAPVTVNSTAIPWLILSAVPTNTVGPGIFERTTYIQRVNTTGGLAPSTVPTELGQQSRVNYSAEYIFYRAAK
jgi:hypothetical protein